MNTLEQKLVTVLKDGGYSATSQRMLVFKTLLGQPPISMNALNKITETTIDRASLYRTIKLFEELRIVHRVYIGWKYKIELGDMFSQHHHHASCVKCGAIIEITDETALEEAISRIAQEHNITPISHQLEIQGYCHKCSSINADIESI